MYIIKNPSEEYHVFDILTQKYIKTNLSLRELLIYFKHYDEMNLTMKDTKFISCKFYMPHDGNWSIKFDRKWGIRRYVVFDKNYRIINVKRLAKENLGKLPNKIDKREDWYIYRMRKYVGNHYMGIKFRREPVPYVNNKRYYCENLRKVKIANELKHNIAPEVAKFVRPSRRKRAFPNYWSEVYRHVDKSWKTQSKKEKQWM